MSPFVLFRMWARRAPLSSRLGLATVAALVVAVLAWIAVPGSGPSSHLAATGGFSPSGGGGGPAGPSAAVGVPSGGSVAGPAGSASRTPATTLGASSSTGPSSVSAGASGGTPSPGTVGGTSGPTGTGSGPAAVSGGSHCAGPLTPVKVGVVVPDIGSGSASLNSTFGVPSASQEEADFGAAFDSINKAGGVDCHSLVGEYADFNETDSSAPQTECLQFVQDKVFAVLSGWLPESSDVCSLQNHLPTIEQLAIPGSLVKQFYPYYLSADGELDLIFHNFAQGMAHMGYLSAAKGFKKVGIFYRDCISGEYQTMVGQLQQAGVAGSAITNYDVGCPYTPFAPPSTVEAAILKFQQSGVTDVIPMNEYEDLQSFTRQANSQGYKPQYLVADDGIVATSAAPTFQPDATNFNGAVAVTPAQYGAIKSGLPETAPTRQCDQIMTSHGLPTVYQSGDQYAGAVCNLVWMLAAGMGHDQSLSREGEAPGLAAAGSVPFSFPDGPNDFRASSGTFGGQYWRPLQYQGGCGCWKVTNPNFSPSYP